LQNLMGVVVGVSKLEQATATFHALTYQ